MKQHILAVCAVLAAMPLHAQSSRVSTGTEPRLSTTVEEGDAFYQRLLRRGIDNVQANNHEAAARELRIAAFGLINNLSQFQTAHIYLAVASNRAHREADALQSALRVVAAERIQPGYAAIQLPAQIRSEFDGVASRLLTAQQRSVLSGTPQASEQVAAAPAGVTTLPEAAQTPPPQQRQTPPPAPVQKTETTTAQQPAPSRPAVTTAKPLSLAEIGTALGNAERALMRNDLAAARTQYHKLIDEPAVDHASALRLAEGLYRARDFAGTLRAFKRVTTLQKGEEYFRYYRAVALFETGDVQGAKAEFAAALPYIELTPDVANYRAKIEGAPAKR